MGDLSEEPGGGEAGIYETIFRSIDDAVFLIDVGRTNGEYAFTYRRNNPSHQQQTGLPEHELRGQTPRELLGDEQGATIVEHYRQCAQREEPIEYEETLELPAGTTHWRTKLTPIIEDGQVSWIVGTSSNITARKEREQELQQLKERLELAVDGANLGVWDWDMTTDEVQFNDNWATMLGYDPDEIRSHLEEWEMRVHPDDMDSVETALDEHIAGDSEYYDTEHRMRTADGNWKWIRDIGKVVERDENGEPIRAVGIHADVDERKRAQRALREEREMFTQGPVVVFKWREDDGWPVEYVSDNVEDVSGYTPSQLESGDVPFSEVLHDEDSDRVAQEIDENSDPETDQFSHEPYRVVTADGDVRWVLDNTKNIRDGDEITHRLGYLVDITERKERERSLKRQQAFLENTTDIVALLDENMVVQYQNHRNEHLPYPKALDMVGQDAADGIHPDDLERAITTLETVLEEPGASARNELRLKTATGEWRWYENRVINLLDDPAVGGILMSSRDITDRKRQEKHLETAQEVANLGWWRKEIPSDRIYWSERVYDMWNVEGTGGYLDHERFLEFIHPDDAARVQQAWQNALKGEPYDIEHRIITGDGETRWMRQRADLVFEDGAPVSATGVVQDITDRKERERELEQTTQRLTVALEGTNTGVWEWDLETDEVIWTPSMERLFGVEPGTFGGTYDAFVEYVHPDDLPALEASIEQTVTTGEPLQAEYRIQTDDGRQLWGEVRAELTERDGGSQRLIGIVTEITERKEREQELKRSRELVEKTQENASIGWWEVDLVEDTLHWSDEVYRIHDLPVDEEVKLEDGIDFYHPEARPTIKQALEKLTREGEPYDLELRIVTAEDRVRWIRTVGDPQFNDDGEVVGVLGIFQDITKRKEREHKLRQFREAIERTAHAVYITDTDGTIEYVNPAFEEITGFATDEVVGQTPSLLKSGEHSADYYEGLWETIESGERWEDEVIDQGADGEQLVLNQTIAPIVDDDGVPQKYVAVAQDITLRKQYEEELEQARTELRQIIDLVPDLLFAKNRKGEYLLANEATADAYGLTPAEVEGKRESDIIPSVDDSVDFRADDIEVLDSGEPKEDIEEKLTTADGETKILQTTKIPYEASDSGEAAVLGYARDVTDLKEYEQVLERQRDNLKVLNQVVRHDIRNDLQLVLAYAETLESYVQEGGEEYVRQVLEAAHEAVDITTTARDVTEVLLQRDAERTPVGLRRVLENEIEAVRASSEQALVTVEGSIPRVEVFADDMLGSAIRNLLKNAIMHNDAEVPEVTVDATVSGGVARIQIADNGPGIPDDQKERIFEEGEKGLDSGGTGLGLYLVRTLIDRYEGHVRVEDREGRGASGSVFVVELPLVDD